MVTVTTQTLIKVQTGGFGRRKPGIYERVTVEHYADSPRLHVRHQRARGGENWTTLTEWELGPDGIQKRGEAA